MVDSLLAAGATDVVENGLAPFVAIGTITATCSAVAAFAAKLEASRGEWDRDRADAYLQSMINEGVAVGASIAFWPVCFLIADALV